jgi:hypothetical protein
VIAHALPPPHHPNSITYPYRISSGQQYKVARYDHPRRLEQKWWLKQLRRRLAQATLGRDSYFCFPQTIRTQFTSAWRGRYLPNVTCIRQGYVSSKPAYFVRLLPSGHWFAERRA